MIMWCSNLVCIVTFILSLLAAPRGGEAPPGGKMPRLGILRPGTPPQPWVKAFWQGLHALGYVEGQTVTLEIRWDEYQRERWPELAADLVRLQVDIIVAGTNAAAQAAQHATRTIPIVMAVSSDP